MTAEELAGLRQTLAGVKSSLEELRAAAEVVLAQIDGQNLLRDGLDEKLDFALRSYRENAALLLRTGAELSISVGSGSFSAYEQELARQEEQLKRAAAAEQLVRDYLRLTADAEDIRLLLERTKAELQARYAASELPEGFLSPYRVVVETVQTGSTFSEDDFDLVSDHLGRPIARALDRRELFFPSDSPEEKELPEPDEQETADETDAEPDEAPAKNEEPVADDTALLGEGFSSYADTVTVTLRDTDASKLSVKKAKSEWMTHPDLLRALYCFGARKLSAEDTDERPETDGFYSPAKDIVRFLRNKGYLAELTLTADGESYDYLTLSSKAWALYSRRDFVSYVKSLGRESQLLLTSLRSPASDWTAADALAVHWLCRYFRIRSVAADFSVFVAGPALFIALDETYECALFSAVAQREAQETLIRSMASFLRFEGPKHYIILVGAKSDIPLLLSALSRQYPEETPDFSSVRFCIAESFDELLDANGDPCPFPEETEEAAEDFAEEVTEEAEEAIESVTEEVEEEYRPETAEETMPAPVEPIEVAEETADILPLSHPHTLTVSPDAVEQSVKKMLLSGEFACATAFLKALSLGNSDYNVPYMQLAYALDDPMATCDYSSSSLLSVFYDENSVLASEEYLIAAALRSFFSAQNPFDFGVNTLQSTISGLSVFSLSPALSQAVYQLAKYKSEFRPGMETYADYRLRDFAYTERRISALRKDADELLLRLVDGKTRENVSFKRFIETQKIVFSRDGELAMCLRLVADDKREDMELIREVLKSFVPDGLPMTPANLDDERIASLIRDAWNRAEENLMLKKNNTSLMGSRYSNISMNIRRILTLLCDYLSTVDNTQIDQNAESFKEYRRLRGGMLEALDTAIGDVAAYPVLSATLRELRTKLDGSYREDDHRYFYVDFLRSDNILLDDNYLPCLDSVYGLDSMTAEARILRHFEGERAELRSRLEDIFNGGDDYGSAALILRYLDPDGEDAELNAYREDFENASLQPLEYVADQQRSFVADLEMAQSHGQIDNAEGDYKDTVLYTVEQWRDLLEESRNYGFFSRILEAFRGQIRENALARSADLNASLSAYLGDHPHWEEDSVSKNAVARIRQRIENQNYTAAEDLLNRLLTGDTETDSVLSDQTDYLEEFLAEYDANYSQIRLPDRTVSQQMRLSIHNKDTRGGARIIEAWPSGSGSVNTDSIASLFSALGFPVSRENVKKEDAIQGKIHFTLRLSSPSNGRRVNYKHPIWVFGSQAEKSDIRIVCIFGRMDADRLIDTFHDIGSARDTVILLDYALTVPERRKLARKAKANFNGRTFAVIDRVVVAYLARHYAETDVLRRLMGVILPYAYFNPYISESSQVMPSEIFIGRRTELEKIEAPGGVNLVYGGRQLGKSALLKKARQNIDRDEKGDRAIWVEIKDRDYRAACRKVSEELSDQHFFNAEFITEDWAELARAIKNRLTNEEPHIPYFLLLLDEADAFIESCAAVKYAPFDELKGIMSLEGNRFKFVVAGLRDVVRLNRGKALSGNSGLTQLSSLTVMPFRISEARELIELPLYYLGFRFPDNEQTDALISSICATTNYFPGLLQLYCTKLLEAMQQDYAGYPETETPPYYVREEHIKRALADSALHTQIKEKFDITLKVVDDNYYYLIALLGAFLYHSSDSNRFTSADILRCAEDYSLSRITSLGPDTVNALMQEMCQLNVFRTSGDAYRFSRFSFYQMMGTAAQIEDSILAYATGEES